jgi:NADH:ubiquinone oxidoreductase subunit F (NADH-binding)
MASAARPGGVPAAGHLARLLPPSGQPGGGRPGGGRPGSGLSAHLDRFGPLPYRGGPGLLIPEIAAAGLTGRGGAGFPVHRKLAAVAGHRAGRAIVAGNGAEGEPASDKDKTLLREAPHLVLDGLQLAAEAVQASTAVLYVCCGRQLRYQLTAVIGERADLGLEHAPVRLVAAPPRFLAGQESALASRISGGAALPRFTPPQAGLRGADGRPVLVQNVETLAQLALIARYGAAWFRGAGTPDEPGTMLCTLRQADGSVQVAEVPIGTPLAGLLDLADAGAVLAGGYHGSWLPAGQAAGLTLSNADLRPFGASVGAGVLAALPASRCGLAETARVARYLALESAGQCGPCLNGLPVHRGGAGAGREIAAAARGAGRPEAVGGTDGGTRRVPSSGRDCAVRAQRTANLRGRDSPASAGRLLGHERRGLPAGPGRACGRIGLELTGAQAAAPRPHRLLRARTVR